MSFQAVATSIILYGDIIWTITKWMKEELDGSYTRMLRAVWNISWKQHPTKKPTYLPPQKPSNYDFKKFTYGSIGGVRANSPATFSYIRTCVADKLGSFIVDMEVRLTVDHDKRGFVCVWAVIRSDGRNTAITG